MEAIGVNHYPRHIGDITRDTFGLTLIEFGAYDRLLDAYYGSEKPLPFKQHERHRLAGARTKEECAAVDYVVEKFFFLGPDGWHQKRVDEELSLYRSRSAMASASAQARWCKSNANAMRTHSDGNASHKPVTSNHKPTTTTPPAPLPPSGVSHETWTDWIAQKGRKLTPAAYRQQVKFLAGQPDPDACVAQSVRNSWAGLFPTDRGNGQHKSYAEQKADRMAVITGRKSDARIIDSQGVDRAPVPALPSDLRKPGDRDVE